MRQRYLYLGLLVLACAALAACGIWLRQRPAAPMAGEQGQVAASWTILPEDLAPGELLAVAGDPLMQLVDQREAAVYAVMGNGYRRWTLQLENAPEPKFLAPSPDGGYWMVLEEAGLIKASAQGTVLVQQPLDQTDVRDMACDSVGRVYLIVNNGTEILRFSPEGALQGTAALETELVAAELVVQKDRLFVAYTAAQKKWPQRVEYAALTDELTLEPGFCGCVKMADAKQVHAIGSFLPEYALMEYDDVGLYACREDGCWETVCLWEALHLDGNLRGKLCSDAQGRGALLYEKDGETYILTLFEAKNIRIRCG